MERLRWTRSTPYSREARERLADYLIRVTSILVPLLGIFLLFRWYIGALHDKFLPLAIAVIPMLLVPRLGNRLGLEGKAVYLLAFSSIATAMLFATSGLMGVGPLLSALAGFIALVFFDKRVFVVVISAIALALLASGISHYQAGGHFQATVDLGVPVNIVGRIMVIGLTLAVLLAGLHGATRLVSEQRGYSKLKSQEFDQAIEELDRFIDSANAPIFGVDREGRVSEWNLMTVAITGYTKEEALGKPLVDSYIAQEYKEEVTRVLDLALEGAGTANYEFPLYTKTGERLEILLNATSRLDPNGVVIGVIGVGQDITRLRQQEGRLRSSQKMEALGRLTGGIAHDFNNLLAVIQGNLTIALDPRTSQEEPSFLQESLSDAAAAASDAAKLIRQLLAFTSQQSFRIEKVNLHDLFSGAGQKVFPNIEGDKTFSLNLDDADISIMMDGPQLENAIVSLLNNAKESIDGPGEISVRVSVENLTGGLDSEYSLPAGEYVVATFKDDGRGIDASVLSKVMDPFFTTKEVGEGEGLGLSVVHGFVKKSGGQLRLRSEVGLGTTVDLVLPLVRAEADSRAGGLNKEEVIFPPQSGSVLVVEDEDRLRKLSSRHLRSAGFEVLEAGDSDEALNVLAAREGLVDFLFSDIRMPGALSVRDLATEVSRLYPEVRTLLATGFEEEATKSAGGGPSSNMLLPVLRKPYSREELIGAIIDLA